MPSLVYIIGALVTLFALMLWVRRRAGLVPARPAGRKQPATETRRVAGRDAATGDAVPAAASRTPSSAAAAGSNAGDPAPTARAADRTAMERAAAGMDPIEELISHIVVESAPVSKKPAPAPERQRIRRWAAPLSVRYPSEADSIAAGVPLRELVIAWYESRGYRGSPASPAVWPIELVLRHRDDAARAYAFVVQNDYVSVDRITALIERAREIGMLRVVIVADAGHERGAKTIARKRRVRLIDRSTMEAELLALELPTAAKIVGVARKRAAEAVPDAA